MRQSASSTLAVTVIFLVLGSLYAFRTPVGEAPDEPAHLSYVNYLVAHRALPPLGTDNLSYEFYQPPGEYIFSALFLESIARGPVKYPFVPNPEFRFEGSSPRAFLPDQNTQEVTKIRLLRVSRLLFGALTIFALMKLAEIFSVGRSDIALLAAAPFAFAPQFIHISASINNDTLITTLSSAALLFLARLVLQQNGHGLLPPWLAGLVAGLALWAKASGLILLAPVLFVAWRLRAQRRPTAAINLLAAYSLPVGAWFLFSLYSYGSLMPQFPAGSPEIAPGFLKLVTTVHWLGSLYLSFWGKFGWLTVRLPAVTYVGLLIPTGILVLGLVMPIRHSDARPNKDGIILMRLALLGNLAFLGAFLARVYFQPQGRYLFPCLGAMVSLAATALVQLQDTRLVRFAIRFRFVALAFVLLVSVLGLVQIERAFGG